jgi:hypothetical protein
MLNQLVVMLVVTSLAEERGGARPLRVPPDRSTVVTILVRAPSDGRPRQITLTMPAPPAPADEDDDHPPARLVQPFNVNAAMLERDNFDRWLFADERSDVERWRHLDEILRDKVEAAAREHRLTDPERAKLRVAGKGDIKRFFDQVEDRRSAFESERKSFRTGHAALRRLERFSQIYQEGPFGEGSLFAKTLQRITDDRKDGRGRPLRPPAPLPAIPSPRHPDRSRPNPGVPRRAIVPT